MGTLRDNYKPKESNVIKLKKFIKKISSKHGKS